MVGRLNYRWRVLVDTLLAGVVTVLALATVAGHTAPPLVIVLAVLSAAPIAVRRRAPMSALLVMGASPVAYLLLYGTAPNTGIGLLVGVFSVATYRTRPVAAAGWLVATTLLAIAYARIPTGMNWLGFTEGALLITAAWVLGASTRNWAWRAERAERAVRDERGRIARELHDIVAHHMSVISLQTGVAEYVLDTDLPTARRALVTVGDTSREALTEMRRLLDVLRMDDDDADNHPQPGLADLDALVRRVRDAGIPVEFEITGTATALPAGPDLCAYRTAQEALTNVLRHAGPATARLTVDYGGDLLTLSVTDDGAGRPGPPHASGRGLAGLRERAALYGGTLMAGPRPEGGFRVTVRLPL